jgi:hypothetical protein
MHLKKATESLIHNRGKREKSEREAAIMHHGSSLSLYAATPIRTTCHRYAPAMRHCRFINYIQAC